MMIFVSRQHLLQNNGDPHRDPDPDRVLRNGKQSAVTGSNIAKSTHSTLAANKAVTCK